MWLLLIHVGGADFSSRGTLLSEVFENTSVNWPLNSSASQVQTQPDHYHFFFWEEGYPDCLSSDGIPIEVNSNFLFTILMPQTG